MTDWKTITSHPAADMFPMLSTERHAELVESIRQHGLRVPIVICDDMVLDGRNRLRACLEAGVEPRSTTFDATGNPFEYVWALNGQRRDLDPGQRAAVRKRINLASDEWIEAQRKKREEANARRAEAAREQIKAQERDESGKVKPGSESHDSVPRSKPARTPFNPYDYFPADVEVSVEVVEDDDDDADLLDAQATARDAIDMSLPAGQRAMIAVLASKQAPNKPATKEREAKPAPKYDRARDELARQANVSTATANRVESLANKRPDLLDKVADGTMKLTEAMRQVKREEVAAKVEALPSGPTKYRVIYADPPWQYNDSRAGVEGYAATAAEDHYPTMSTPDICALDIKALAADDSVLLCWATFPLLTDALEVVRAWGFKYKTAIVWDKVRPNFGHYHNASAELLLIATRGSGVPDASKREDQVQVIERTAKHSAKPEEFRALIDRLWTHGARIELFRRGEPPAGWEVWGNEAKAA